eukprot:scaffold16966_cov131-Isochrysis_galbana.AAC.5
MVVLIALLYSAFFCLNPVDQLLGESQIPNSRSHTNTHGPPLVAPGPLPASEPTLFPPSPLQWLETRDAAPQPQLRSTAWGSSRISLERSLQNWIVCVWSKVGDALFRSRIRPKNSSRHEMPTATAGRPGFVPRADTRPPSWLSLVNSSTRSPQHPQAAALSVRAYSRVENPKKVLVY